MPLYKTITPLKQTPTKNTTKKNHPQKKIIPTKKDRQILKD